MKRPEIIFEDEYLVGINKPPGLRSIPDRYNPSLPSVYQIFSGVYPNIFMIHRLDKDTSGTLIMAKDADSHRAMNFLFQERKIGKKYLVLIEGNPLNPEGVIDQPIKLDRVSKRHKVGKKGKEAKTTYRVLEYFSGYSLVEADIHTGRTHQIRVHFPFAGMPLVCDPIYGNEKGLYLSSFKRKYRKSGDIENPLMGRLSLHSSSLQFEHPHKNENFEISSPLPKDFKASLSQLRKWASSTKKP